MIRRIRRWWYLFKWCVIGPYDRKEIIGHYEGIPIIKTDLLEKEEGKTIKNTECIIYITTKNGWIQSYYKEKDTWVQVCPNRKVRKLSAEQLLSHILPVLAKNNLNTIKVEPRGE